MRQITKLAALVLLSLLPPAGLACVQGVEPDAEDRPIDTRDNLEQLGLYDCSEHSDTGYRSGDAFTIRVVTVDGRAVERNTANAYIAMQERARQAGVTLRIVSGFRTMDQQEYLYGCYVNCSCNNCNLAARPGYSNHQSGHALDLNTSEAGVLSWLNNHADEYGFSRTVPSEDWHWEYWGAVDFDGPCGSLPECWSGNYDGAFCDDDQSGSEAAHDRLQGELGVNFHCSDIAGEPAFCPTAKAKRGDSAFVLLKAAGAPTSGHPDAFSDDEGHAREIWMNAAKAFGVLLGSNGRGNPDGVATRSTLAIMLARLYRLPPASQDYFDDDDGSANEDAHNQVAEAGLFAGYADNNGGRKDFRPSVEATRSTLAVLAGRAADAALVPVWDIPSACLDGSYAGAYCDDDGATGEAILDELAAAGTTLPGRTLGGSPAVYLSKPATRAEAMAVLGGGAEVPLTGHPDAFGDDEGHALERYLDAAKAYGILLGYQGGTEGRPDALATRTTLAIMLARIYALPEASQDFFSDDDGTANEAFHNRVGQAGLFVGYDDGQGGKEFRGERDATRGALATVAQRARDGGLVPVWAPPASPADGDDPPPADDPSADPTAPPSDDPIDDPDDGQTPVDGPPADDEGALEGPPPGFDDELQPSVSDGGCQAVPAASLYSMVAVLLADLKVRRRKRKR